jgi:hypothetical protein
MPTPWPLSDLGRIGRQSGLPRELISRLELNLNTAAAAATAAAATAAAAELAVLVRGAGEHGGEVAEQRVLYLHGQNVAASAAFEAAVVRATMAGLSNWASRAAQNRQARPEVAARAELGTAQRGNFGHGALRSRGRYAPPPSWGRLAPCP